MSIEGFMLSLLAPVQEVTRGSMVMASICQSQAYLVSFDFEP